MIVTCSIECSTLESANWKSKDEAIQMHLSSLKEEANHIKMWSKPTSFTCHDPSNSSEKGRGLKRTSHEGCIEKRVKMSPPLVSVEVKRAVIVRKQQCDDVEPNPEDEGCDKS